MTLSLPPFYTTPPDTTTLPVGCCISRMIDAQEFRAIGCDMLANVLHEQENEWLKLFWRQNGPKIDLL